MNEFKNPKSSNNSKQKSTISISSDLFIEIGKLAEFYDLPVEKICEDIIKVGLDAFQKKQAKSKYSFNKKQVNF